MNFGQLAIRSVFILVLLFVLSLAGAITFPVLAISTTTTGLGIVNILSLIITMIVLAVIGYLLGRGIRSIKKPLESLILTYVSSFILGGVLALFTYLNVPYAARINLTWLGASWYSPWLAVFLIGTTIMIVFLVGEP
ncbi:hypothetical protein EPA93_24205 [Ktedonosporobacter rubrisoli]|uniref:Uncharacterized protein n=1 Tax=Ktedonosporobacter rubrisoli TaxID=2509675 RepID=A0A4P6JVD2_KTERU|nr:hypothetical protein [Ktedonosporobacter rubrisoli]QBD78916.1 hypothetical protein EPA93_24205 [Ktedonosporobacter rubrisoli]